MFRLFLFDLRRRLRPDARRLQAQAMSELAEIPEGLVRDLGLTSSGCATFAEARAASMLQARQAEDARNLLESLNRIAAARGFARLRWRDRGHN